MEPEGARGLETELETNQQTTRPLDPDTHEEQVEENGASNTSGEGERGQETTPSSECKEILKAMEVVERDSVAIAQSFTSLFASLRLSLSQVTSTSIDHMSCFSDAAGRLQECALDAATKGNRYINSCLRLNEEIKGIENLASQLKILRRNVDAMDSAVNRIVRLPDTNLRYKV